MAFFIEGQVIV